MKKIKVLMAATMLVSILGVGAPVYSQTNPESRTTTASYDDDKETNYGWIGLLGLVGLAGFMKRNNDARDARVTNSPKYNS